MISYSFGLNAKITNYCDAASLHFSITRRKSLIFAGMFRQVKGNIMQD